MIDSSQVMVAAGLEATKQAGRLQLQRPTATALQQRGGVWCRRINKRGQKDRETQCNTTLWAVAAAEWATTPQVQPCTTHIHTLWIQSIPYTGTACRWPVPHSPNPPNLTGHVSSFHSQYSTRVWHTLTHD